MFENLVASTNGPERSLRPSLLSVACHAAVFLATIALTRTVVVATPANPTESWIFRAPVESPAGAPAAPAAPHPAPAPARTPGAIAPTAVTVGVPAVVLSSQGGPGLPQLLPMPDHDPITPRHSPFGAPREVPHQLGEVDEPVQRISGPRPVYPPALRAAGIEGVVRLRMVVDTLGRVEMGSLVVVASSHPGFEAAAKEAIAQSRYSAARLHGVAVRQLVQQSVRFAIES